MTKYEALQQEFHATLVNLEEVLKQEKTVFIRDSAIKRFELCFDLAWKFLKECLEEEHSVKCVSPRTCFREAFRLGLLVNYNEYWMKITSVRNYTVHTYKEALAELVYKELPEALAAFKKLEEAIQEQNLTDSAKRP